MQYALVDSNGIVDNVTELEDQSNLLPLPTAPTQPEFPPEPVALPAEPSEEQQASHDVAMAAIAAYPGLLAQYNTDFAAYQLAYQAAMKPRYTVPNGMILVQVTDATGPASIGAKWDGSVFTTILPPEGD